MDVSIIIVNYNTLKVTAECIESVFKMTSGISFEVILIDNASTDGSKEHFSADTRIRYIYSESNLGFGKANNEAIGLATGRNILFLNPDTLLLNNAVKILSDYLDCNERVGACGGNLYNAEMSPVISFERRFPSILSEVDYLFKGYLYKLLYGSDVKFNHSGKNIDVAYIVGADLMVRRTVLDEVGGFDPHFFMYYEEVELCRRIFKRNYRICNLPSAEIMHLEGMSTQKKDIIETLIRSEGLRLHGRKIYFDLTHGKLYHKLANAVRLAYLYSRLIWVKDAGALKVLNATLNKFKDLYS